MKRARRVAAPVPDEPIARGSIVVRADTERANLSALAKEIAAMSRALRAPADETQAVPPDADYVVLLVDDQADLQGIELPDLTDRTAAALAISTDAPDGRAAVAAARKRLRSSGAWLGPRTLVLSPEQFGVIGLESDGQRERLEILMRTLVLDAERLRLKREGWEEPEQKGE